MDAEPTGEHQTAARTATQQVVPGNDAEFGQLVDRYAPVSEPAGMGMVCPKCGSRNVVVSASATEKQKARHGILYWVFVGWWLHPIMWICATLPMLIWRIIRPNRKTKTVITTTAVCQTCGHTWIVKQ